MREEAKRLREEPLSGFTYLAGALYKENLWRTRLRAFGLDAQNARNPQEIPGARQAQTAKERSKAHGVLQNLLVWQTAAKAGLMIIIGAWALDQVVAGFRRSAGAGFRPQALLDVQGWLPGPPELSDKLFDVLHFVVVEARAEVLGYCMEEYPDDPGSEQAAYLHAGLLRTRMDPEIGDRRIAALSTLAGADNARARELQLRQELPGALPIAWDAVGLAGGISGLRDSVARIIEEAGKDVVNREAERRVDPTESVDETLALRSRKKKKDPEQEFGDDVVLSLTPERSAEELPGIQLFQTQEAVRQELEERIKRYGLTKKEAEVARLRFEGKETHEIATTMGTKEKTIWVHERNIRQKTCSAGG